MAIGRRELGGWLDGPGARPGGPGSSGSSSSKSYPGQRLGCPQTGPGSVARFGRRLVGVCIDWALALLIANGLMRGLGWGTFAPLAAFLTMHVVLVGTVGCTAGHRIVGLAVVRLDGGPAGPIRSLVRSVLLCLVVPPLVWDHDQRGLHDKAAGTLVVRR